MPFPLLFPLAAAAGAAAPSVIALSRANKNTQSNLYNPEIVGDGEQSEYVQSRAPYAAAPTTPTTATTTPTQSFDTPSPLAYNPNAALWTPSQMIDSIWSKGNILNPAVQDQVKEVLTSSPQTQQTATTSEPVNTTTTSPSFDKVVNGVIAGNYGNGKDRVANIAATGQDPAAVQKAVNAKMQGSKKTAPIRQANPEVPGLNQNGNWMQTLNALLPYLALAGGAYYAGRKL